MFVYILCSVRLDLNNLMDFEFLIANLCACFVVVVGVRQEEGGA
jgi:hypothetical protein